MSTTLSKPKHLQSIIFGDEAGFAMCTPTVSANTHRRPNYQHLTSNARILVENLLWPKCGRPHIFSNDQRICLSSTWHSFQQPALGGNVSRVLVGTGRSTSTSIVRLQFEIASRSFRAKSCAIATAYCGMACSLTRFSPLWIFYVGIS